MDTRYRNMVDDPYLKAMSQRERDFCACGLAATGDQPSEQPPADAVEATPAGSLQAWRYARAALMLVGAYVVATFLYKKFVKS